MTAARTGGSEAAKAGGSEAAKAGGSEAAKAGGSETGGGDTERPARSRDASQAVMTTPVLPADTNTYGNLFGGHLVALIDKTASITAGRHAGRNVVTASIDRVDFIAPVRLGDILTVIARLNHVGRTSMEVGVEVTREDGVALSGGTRRDEATRACTALLTFVAVDQDGRPVAVPPLELASDEDRQAFADGAQRAAERRRKG